MTAPVRRVTVPSAVGENRKRVGVLEAVPTLHWGVNLGDWVTVIAENNDSAQEVNIGLFAGDNAHGINGTGLGNDYDSVWISAGNETTGLPNGVVALTATDQNAITAGLFVGEILLTQTLSPFHTYLVEGVAVQLNFSGTPPNAQRFSVNGREVLHCLEIQDDYVVDWLVNSWNITLANTATFEVHDTLGNPIFRINQDGSLQGKTGQTLTFNL